jgi:chromosome segregation ATPase
MKDAEAVENLYYNLINKGRLDMPKKGNSQTSVSKERKISKRRLLELRAETDRTERHLSTLQKRSEELKNRIGSSKHSRRKLVMEVEFLDSEATKLNAALDRLSKTHSDYVTKNQKLDQGRSELAS